VEALSQPPAGADIYEELASERPDIEALSARFDEVTRDRDENVFARAKRNYDTRYTYWAGQTDDGKRHARRKGEDVFPFDGAADHRVPAVDMFIREDAAKLMLAWRRMKVSVAGTEANDTDFATRMTQLLRWVKYTQMTESRREMRLLCNWLLERGSVVLGVFWKRETQLGYQTLTLDEIGAMAQAGAADGQAGPMAQFSQMVVDPLMEEAAAAMIAGAFPSLKPARARRVVRELRTAGRAEFPVPYLRHNRPEMAALLPNEDIFLPPEATDLQGASEIFRREVLTETQLRERVTGAGWDEDWVNAVVENQRGSFSNNTRTLALPRTLNGIGQLGRGVKTTQLFEVIHAYTRRADEDGVPGIFYTVFHPNEKERAAWHGLLNYEHGEYPFVHFETESRSRMLDDARGYGERAATLQQAIKVQWDARTDRTSVATFPPMFHPPNLPPERWGPGVKIGTNRREQYGFAEIPRWDPGSKEIEQTMWEFLHRYFGRAVSEFNAAEAGALQQELVENFMAACAVVDTQILKLCQQLMPEEFYYRVVGSAKAQTVHATRAEIQGAFDLSVNYSAADANPEVVTAKIGLVAQMIQQWNVGSVVDFNELMQYGFELLDPNLGERVLRPSAEASQAEVDGADTDFAKIFAGIPAEARPGQNYELRLQRTQQNLEQNTVAQGRLAQDAKFKEDLEAYVKQLQFQIEQRQNAAIGVKGPMSRGAKQMSA
jgi:hypothetical protein